MFRIATNEELSQTKVTIDGQLTDECIDLVENCCNHVLAAGRPLEIYLRDVSSVDKAGRALLLRMAAEYSSVETRRPSAVNSRIADFV